ncbi:MAG: hypothetical protein HLUCCO16_14035 [Phormidium sp. OSCR]|nr:MAG: hypothetical protein HLUCCO16_14035 [Phormidium sp. OSCR]
MRVKLGLKNSHAPLKICILCNKNGVSDQSYGTIVAKEFKNRHRNPLVQDKNAESLTQR